MKRFSKIGVLLSIFSLVVLSSSQVRVAAADAGFPLTKDSASCEAAPSTARDGEHNAAVAAIRARLAATPTEKDIIPLNGSGYNYNSDTHVSNELLLLDAELQRQKR